MSNETQIPEALVAVEEAEYIRAYNRVVLFVDPHGAVEVKLIDLYDKTACEFDEEIDAFIEGSDVRSVFVFDLAVARTWGLVLKEAIKERPGLAYPRAGF